MQADLQAFLEYRPTAAELEQCASWKAGATIVAAREALRKATRTLVRARRTLKVAGALAWFLVGMCLSVGGIKAWWAWRARHAEVKQPVAAAPVHKPVPPPAQPEWLLYTEPADKILSAYSNSADPALDDFDWPKAEVLFEHAIKVGDKSSRTAAGMALAQGYATLERLGSDDYSNSAAAQLSAEARADFAKAAATLPADAAPHLALARLYVYTMPNLERAIAEFATAQRLGAALGRREIEQQADAYRMSAERGAARHPRQAWKDVQTAKRIYERVRGFDQVEMHLKELARIRYGAPRRQSKPPRRSRWR
jgi:hypothetical protein